MLTKKHLTIIGLVFAGLFILLTIIWFIARPQATVNLRLAPTDVTMEVNGQEREVTNGQTLKLKPGIYTLKFSADGFKSTTETTTLEDNQKLDFPLALEPATDQAKQLISSDQSQQIVKDYYERRKQILKKQLPIKSRDFTLISCPSLENPEQGDDAFCINSKSSNAKQAAINYVDRIGFKLDRYEILVGENDLMKIAEEPKYKAEFYFDDHENRPAIYVTALDTPYVPYDTEYNAELENLRKQALTELAEEGYTEEDYDIYFSNSYLSKYNPDPHGHED